MSENEFLIDIFENPEVVIKMYISEISKSKISDHKAPNDHFIDIQSRVTNYGTPCTYQIPPCCQSQHFFLQVHWMLEFYLVSQFHSRSWLQSCNEDSSKIFLMPYFKDLMHDIGCEPEIIVHYTRPWSSFKQPNETE